MVDQINIKDIQSVLKLIIEILAIIVPTVVAGYVLIDKRIKAKLKQLSDRDRDHNIEILKNFSYHESLASLVNIKSIVNMFCDRGSAEVVSYFQLEDGTVAESKLHNMYLSCVAESDRYSTLPKWLHKIQRVPASQVLTSLDILNQHSESGLDEVIEYSTLPVHELAILCPRECKAYRARAIHNPDGYVVGYVDFRYDTLLSVPDGKDISELTESEYQSIIPGYASIINECKAAIEAELVRFDNTIKLKKYELGLDQPSHM